MGLTPFGTDLFIKEAIKTISVKYPLEVRKWLIDKAQRLQRKVKLRTPVRTGHLRRNWKISEPEKKNGQWVITIYNDVEYAPHVEYGTERQKGRFMLNVSVSELQSEMPDHLYRLLRETIGGMK